MEKKTNEIIDDVVSVGPEFLEFLELASISEKVPEDIYQEMKMAGMFEEKKEDDYVNSEAFPVVLSHKYYEDDGSSFINMLKLAIRKRYDEEVFGVIKDFYEFEGVIKVILDSKVPKYVSKIIKMPERLCDKLLKGDDDVDGKIKDFVSNNDNYSIYLEYVIVENSKCQMMEYQMLQTIMIT